MFSPNQLYEVQHHGAGSSRKCKDEEDIRLQEYPAGLEHQGAPEDHHRSYRQLRHFSSPSCGAGLEPLGLRVVEVRDIDAIDIDSICVVGDGEWGSGDCDRPGDVILDIIDNERIAREPGAGDKGIDDIECAVVIYIKGLGELSDRYNAGGNFEDDPVGVIEDEGLRGGETDLSDYDPETGQAHGVWGGVGDGEFLSQAVGDRIG